MSPKSRPYRTTCIQRMLRFLEGLVLTCTMLEYLSKISWLGGQLGAGPLVFGSPKNRIRGDLTFDEALKIAVPFFRSAAGNAQKNGTILCLEPNPPEYGCDFVTNTREALSVVEQVAHPGFRLHLDS